MRFCRLPPNGTFIPPLLLLLRVGRLVLSHLHGSRFLNHYGILNGFAHNDRGFFGSLVALMP